MTHVTDYKKGWQPTKNYQYLTDNWYDSRMEGNDTALLKLLGGIEWCEQGITFTVPFIPGGCYKPDMWYAQQPNRFKSIGSARTSLVLVEYKGWENEGDWRNQAIRQFICDMVDSPDDFIVGYVWVMRDDKRPEHMKKNEDWSHGGIKMYDGKSKEWEDAALYTCKNASCKHTFYAVKTRNECPYCGNKETQFRTDLPNSRFIELWNDHVTVETCKRMEKAYQENRRVSYKETADQVIKEFLQAFSVKGESVFEPVERPHVTELDGVDYKQVVRDAYNK